jgi:phosphoadenosine phosphosulfate reductase
MIEREFPGRIALVSSFGSSGAVLLHMAASVDRSLPVIFLDTGKHFGETLRYRDRLIAALGLRDVRTLMPDPSRLERHDPDGSLWATNPPLCCQLRKVEPLQRALGGFAAWLTGRQRSHGDARADIAPVEVVDGRFKVNPLAAWTPGDIDAYFRAHELPRHPLEGDGFRSIGCMPCTDRTSPDEAPRVGRWRGQSRTECGIHLSWHRLAEVDDAK